MEPLRTAFLDDPWEATVIKAYMSRTQLAAYGFYNSSPLDYDWEKHEGVMFSYITLGVGCSLVEVDCLTGGAQDRHRDGRGPDPDPAIDIGQIEGAWVQGYNYMTMEEMMHRENGEILTRNLSTYKVNTVTCQQFGKQIVYFRFPPSLTFLCSPARGWGSPY